MTRFQFWLINGTSLLVALLIALEIRSVHQLDDATSLAQQAQVPLLQAQQQAPQIQRLIQRTALGATRDSALKDLLSKYGISVNPAPAEKGPAASPPAAFAPTTSTTAASSP